MYRHGIYIQETATPLTPPVQVDSAMPIAVGVAPVHRLEDPQSAVNKPIIVYSYGEGVDQVGYSDNWKLFTLSEMLYSQFRIHNVAPLVMINVWDPTKNAQDVAAVSLPIVNGTVTIDDEMAMISTVTIETYVRDQDYTLEYDGDQLLIKVIGSAEGNNPPWIIS